MWTFVLVLLEGITGIVLVVDVVFLAGVAVVWAFGGCAAGVASSCAWRAAGGGTGCRVLLVGSEECHELGCLGKEFLLLGFKLLEVVVLCGCECGGMLLGVFKGTFETVGVLEDGLVVGW